MSKSRCFCYGDPLTKKNSLELPCSHIFHASCIRKLHKAICPVCNAAFGTFNGLGANVLASIKRRNSKDIAERKKETEESDAIVAAEMQEAEGHVVVYEEISDDYDDAGYEVDAGDYDLLMQAAIGMVPPPQELLQMYIDDDADDEDDPPSIDADDADDPPVIPMEPIERGELREVIKTFFAINYNNLGHNDACHQAHDLVHERRDNGFMYTDCDEINNLIADVLGLN
jgi:hypothetical protein